MRGREDEGEHEREDGGVGKGGGQLNTNIFFPRTYSSHKQRKKLAYLLFPSLELDCGTKETIFEI